jgi:hypothetical protein
MTFDSDLRNRLQQITGMGTNANGYAQQIASAQKQFNDQQEQARQQKLMQDANAKWQQQQSALMSQQAQQQQTALQNALGQVPSAGANMPGYDTAKPGGSNIVKPTLGKGNTFDNFLNAIVSQESGGNYKAMGVPVGGDRAYGRYQVMGNNIPSWTKAALGHSLTPQQYLASPQAQDAVAKYKLGGYYNKYGPEGAAVAWYAGEGTAQRYVRNPQGFNKPQGQFPAISGYAHSILRKMGLR